MCVCQRERERGEVSMSKRFVISSSSSSGSGSSFGRLHSGEELDAGAFLSYETYGSLNEHKNNCVLWVTCYAQRTTDMVEPFIGKGKRFDPDSRGGLFLVTVNMPGNGLSFSPTTEGVTWPRAGLTYTDNAKCVNLLMRSLGVSCVALMYGFSMGGMIAWEYCVQFPTQLKSAICVCGSAKCNPANAWFLQTLADTLRRSSLAEVDPHSNRIIGFNGERYPQAMDTFAGIYADWIFDAPRPDADGAVCPNSVRPSFAQSTHGESRAFQQRLHGAGSTAEWFEVFKMRYKKWDALEYYEVSDTWRRGDASANERFNGDLKGALACIEAKMWILPGSTDQYFRAEEIALEASMVRDAVFQPLQSSLGHFAEFDESCQPAINNAISAALAHAGI